MVKVPVTTFFFLHFVCICIALRLHFYSVEYNAAVTQWASV